MNKRAFAVFAGGILAATLAAAQSGGQNPGSQPAPQQGRGSGPGNHGMMGGGGMGGAMMGGFGNLRNIPDLTTDQRNKITAIRRDLRNRQFALMDQMHDQWASTNLYRNGQFDEQAARRSYDATEKLHRQMFENSLDAQKRIDALLTPAQRQQLQRSYGGQQ
jgi:Spy/CpxP family protein refolding chaperone